MRILSYPTLRAFMEEYPEAREALQRWFVVCKNNDFATVNDVQQVFGDVSAVRPDYLVLNIKGGNFRLITRVSFEFKKIWIKGFMRHSEYNHWKP